ncbi:anti-sigma factor [Aquipluma nitroreducens]|uniref:Anti-sigma factor n=1 Tax=Aquipluma nitroreducens TaxID=2010828 RepID=A0A5K7S4A2_9BACT|nr:FecR family protein [Aquipluma nitroreducens]BBE16329.1 anti-sigma factor [Aquipluma nitroreducens]
MQTDNKIQLLQNFLNGSITDQELKNLFVWLNSEKGNMEFEKLLNEKWLTNKFQTTENIDSTILFSRIKTKIEDKQLSSRKQLLIRFRKVAAIFILGLLIPTIYFTVLNPQKDNKKVVYLKESLSNEKIRKMTLPDGTAVWLMSGSTITYPSNFSENKTRNVEITGEAFLNVAKDSLHPFILNLGEVGLKVVGTSFNVMNYGDEDRVNVVLKTGKVDLFKGKYNPDNDFVHLAPGQLMTYKKGEPEFLISYVDVDKYISWINGTLLFHNDRFEEVLKKLGKWYNISIEVNDREISNFLFTATIKNENLDQIVDLLKYSTPFKYSIYKADGVTKLVVEKMK